MLKEDKDDINHKEEMPNLLNEYKPDDQTLKLVKELGKEIFPIQENKSKNSISHTYAVTTLILSAPFLESLLNMNPPLSEDYPEAWG